MRRHLLGLTVAMYCSWSALAVDPAASITKARSELAADRPAAALQLLREATANAAAITDQKQRRAALATIHFYSALASSTLGDSAQATHELRSFFLYGSGSKLDAHRYPAEFVRLFEQVDRQVTKGRAAPTSFNEAYPGYPSAVSSSVWPLDLWGASSEFLILATEEERTAWGRLQEDAARRAFMETFWEARDPDPQTKTNEARIELLQRVAFADVAFSEGGDERGSLSDRGRVFVLLGTPHRVSIRPLSRAEAPYKPHRTIDVGSAMEQWTYFREQLPKKLPHNEVVFRFISEGGQVVRKLQRDFMAEKAMRDAPRALKHD